MKTKLFISIFALMGVMAINNAKAQTYDPLAVQRINDLIAKNDLKATPDAPETWDFATWNDETPKQIVALIFQYKYMKGSASFEGLTTLQTLDCTWGRLTKLDVTNCLQLQTLDCKDNWLTEIDLTNCTQLKTLYCYINYLTKLDIANCIQLQTLECRRNKLIELDLTGLDKLTDFNATSQSPPPLTLVKDEAGEYTCAITLNNPTFGNSAISYSDGVLKSIDNTVGGTTFTMQTNKEGFKLSGIMGFFYSDVGVNEKGEIKIVVYPNPTTGELEIANYKLRITGIEIYDVNGRMENGEWRKQNGENATIVDISHLPAGVYLVKITTEAGEVVRKIVKQ